MAHAVYFNFSEIYNSMNPFYGNFTYLILCGTLPSVPLIIILNITFIIFRIITCGKPVVEIEKQFC